jgi:hypothetical protein
MNRKNPAFGWSNDVVIGVATFEINDSGDLDPPTSSDVPKISNLGLFGDHTGLGVYSCQLVDGPPNMLDVVPTVTGAPSAHAFVATEYVPSTRTVVIEVRNLAGALADLVDQRLKLLCICRDSLA